MGPLGVVAVGDDVLLRLGEVRRRRIGRPPQAGSVGARVCSRVLIPGIRQPLAAGGEILVVEVRVVAVVREGVLVAYEPAARVGDVEIADLALHRQRRLCPRVMIAVRSSEARDVEIAHRRVIAEESIAVDFLPHELRGDGPVVPEIQASRGAPAFGGRGVVLSVGGADIGDRGPGDRTKAVGQRARAAGAHREGAHAVHDAGACIGARHVVDVAGIVLVPGHQAHRRHGR
jgi:hypothetical protein